MDQFNNQGQYNQFQQQQYQQVPPQQPEPAKLPDNNNVQSFDFKAAKTITLDSGLQVDMPRLTTRKVIELAKFLAKDGVKIYNKVRMFNYNKYQEAVANGTIQEGQPYSVNLDDLVAMIVEELDDEQIIKVVSILTGLDEEQALDMDFVDTLEVVEKFAEITNLQKAFKSVQKMVQKFAPAQMAAQNSQQ